MKKLKTDYVNAELNVNFNTKPKYQETVNADGTKSFEEVSVYSVTGDTFGANDINETNTEVNTINSVLYELPIGNLPQGQKVLTITDERIKADTLIDIYTTIWGASPKDVTVVDGRITMTFLTQKADMQVKVRCY